MSEVIDQADYVSLAADIVSAYVSNNSIPTAELPALIETIHKSLQSVLAVAAAPVVEKVEPAVPIRKSITPDYLICLLDGRRFKSLKRHLHSQYNLTPEQYREKFGLPLDYPMVAPNYSAERSAMAKMTGLGRQPGARRGSRRLSK